MAYRFTFLLFVWVSALATAAPRFDVTLIEGGKKTPVLGEQKARWGWLPKEQNVRVLVAQVALKSPLWAPYKTATASTPGSKAFIKGDSLYVQFDGFRETVDLQGGGRSARVQFEWRPDDEAIIEDGCKPALLSLKAQGRVPFPLGFSCQNVGGRLGMVLSPPEGVSFNSSTLFETKGKGESWRYYEIASAKANTDVLGRFNLGFGGKTYEFTLHSLYKESVRAPEKPNTLTVIAGLGYTFLSISSTDLTASSANPILELQAPFFPLVGDVGIAGNIELSVPLSTGTDTMNYTLFDVYGAYRLGLADWWNVIPKVGYLVFSHVHTATQIGLTANQISFALLNEFRFGSHHVFVEFSMCPFGGGVITSNYALSATYANKGSAALGWAAGAKLQSFSAVSGLGIARTFGQMVLFGALAF